MATTTPNYGWPVPTDTDYVKDGAAAIEALGDAIDATVFALPASGFTLISSQTLTASSGVSFTNVFDNTLYNAYKLMINMNGSTTGIYLQYRGRINTTDVTANYASTILCAAIAGTNNREFTVDNGAQATIGATTSAGNATAISVDIFPTADKKFYLSGTGWTGNSYGVNLIGATNITAQSSVYTGFTFYPSTGTITGNVKLYGYQKA